MSAVSCLFLPADCERSVYEENKQRLRNNVESWGFEMHLIEGDGNCCFSAVAFSLAIQKQEIHSLLPNLFTDVGIETKANMRDIAHQLRILAVAEWMQHTEEYKGFLDGDQSVDDEAQTFLQQGHFHGPLGNTMVLALSNVLGLPIIIFSSAHHYPVINISPRVCRAAIPLYVAFNQSGAGHYDAVELKKKVPLNVHTFKSTPDMKCTCGRSGKHCSTMQRCGVLKHKYTTSIRCPCHLAGHGCTPLCQCSNCANPHGVKPRFVHKRVRERRKHAWNELPSKSALYARAELEKIVMGPRTHLEYLHVCQILFLLRRNQMDRDLNVIHKIYTGCLELCQATEVALPLSEKTADDISNIIIEYDKHKKVFESTCTAQLQISHKQ